MLKKNNNLLLIEMLAALVFFSISGAVILQVFAASDRKAEENTARESAIICAQSVAEAYSVCADVQSAVELVFGRKAQAEGNLYIIPLDKECNYSESAEITLELTETLILSEAGEIHDLSIDFVNKEQSLFSLDCSAYKSERGAANG